MCELINNQIDNDKDLEIYIPYEYRNIAKSNHLYYNISTKKWLLSSDHENYEVLKDNFTKVYLVGDYELKDIYKKNGAKWDEKKKYWYTYKINNKLSEYFLD